MVKEVTNRHTPIRVSVKLIGAEIKNEQTEQEVAINNQRISNPRLMDRNMFQNLIGLITHQAIDLISRELDAAKKIMEDIAHGGEPIIESAGESCIYDCELPLRYGLPCKCWLYSCVANSIPIPISLIHPRWLIEGPSFVISWRMSLDYGPSFEQMRFLAEGIEENLHEKLKEK